MKNKVVRQLMTMCMVASLVVSAPVVSWASDTETGDTKSEDTSNEIHISKKGETVTIYEDNKMKLELNGYKYTFEASDVEMYFYIENNYPSILTVEFKDVKIDGVSFIVNSSIDEYKAGSPCYTERYVSLEDLQDANLTDFKEVTYTVTGTLKDGTEVFSKNVIIDRNAFKSLADEDDESSEAEVTPEATEEVAEEPDKSAEMSDTKNDSDIEARLSTLEENTKELEEKNEELESQYNDLKDENEKLKKQNKKLKKQVKELQTSQSEAESDTQEEITPVAEPESTEAPAENTQPVTEYKDATTIRIVQQALNEAGYNCGTPDGLAGGKTTEAITSYQTAKGITVNGLVTDELLQSLDIVEKVQEAVKAEASKAEYSTDYTYDQLSRNPDTYKGKKMKFTGKVLQTGEAGDDMTYARIKINNDINTVMFITYMNDLLGYRLLEDDNITVYGTSCGIYSYKSVGAGTISIPWIHADIIEM